VLQHILIFLADQKSKKQLHTSNRDLHTSPTKGDKLLQRITKRLFTSHHPIKGKNVVVEDRPTFMLLDIFPNFMSLAKSQWHEIIHMETKKPMEKESQTCNHTEKRISEVSSWICTDPDPKQR
jgi:hypothetical protein